MANSGGKYPDSSTLAAIAAYTGDAQQLFTPESGCWYFANQDSTATVDGYNVLSRIGGGRWLRAFGSNATNDGFAPFQQRAITLAGLDPAHLVGWKHDFVRQEGYDTSVSAGGLAVQGATSGGTMGLTAPTGAAEYAGVKNAQFTPIPNQSFYVMSRARVDAGSAATNVWPICLTQTGQSFGDTVPAKCVGLRIVNGVMTMRISDGLASVTAVATTWTVETAAQHIFEIIYNATTITMSVYVDYVLVAQVVGPIVNLTSTPGMPCAFVNNQNDITVQESVSKIACYVTEA